MLLALLFLLMIPFASAENVTIDNTTSIQDTVDNANDSDIIYLSPGTYHEANIKIDKNITLHGLGPADQIIIDGEHKNSIMLINSVSQVKFYNLTFINGKSPDFGGAIHSEMGGQIYVDSCNFINNSAEENGGAIDIAGNFYKIKWQEFKFYGYLNATNCKFINNRAGHDGGAIATYRGNSYIYDSYFSQNYATRDGGAVRGGVFATTYTENCIFDNNTAKEWGGALYNWPGNLTVENCTISNNYAGDRDGGLITSATLTVKNSRIVNNTARKMGGALFIDEEMSNNPSTVIFENNYISGNSAKTASLVYVEDTSATNSNFNNNYWDINPDDDEWANAFFTNGLIENPTQYLDENGNSITVSPKTPNEENTGQQDPTNTGNNPEADGNTTHNNTSTETTQTSETVSEEIINNVNSQGNSTNIANTNIGISNEAINSQLSQASAESEKSAHEIIKNDVSKQTISPIAYVAVILILLAILGYGYYRHNKNE